MPRPCNVSLRRLECCATVRIPHPRPPLPHRGHAHPTPQRRHRLDRWPPLRNAAAFGHLRELHLRYARWDRSQADLVDPRTGIILATIHPLDKARNADGRRRTASPIDPAPWPLPAATTGRLIRRRRSCVTCWRSSPPPDCRRPISNSTTSSPRSPPDEPYPVDPAWPEVESL